MTVIVIASRSQSCTNTSKPLCEPDRCRSWLGPQGARLGSDPQAFRSKLSLPLGTKLCPPTPSRPQTSRDDALPALHCRLMVAQPVSGTGVGLDGSDQQVELTIRPDRDVGPCRHPETFEGRFRLDVTCQLVCASPPTGLWLCRAGRDMNVDLASCAFGSGKQDWERCLSEKHLADVQGSPADLVERSRDPRSVSRKT